MDFKIIKEKNIKISLEENGEILGTATCYFEGTPEYEGKKIGTIGEFEAKSKEYGVTILKKCEEILKEKNINFIVAPMNGNTWKKYRTLKYSNGDPLFLLENVNEIKYNEILLDAGFEEIDRYTSTKGNLDDAYIGESLNLLENNLKKENILIREFNKKDYKTDLTKIYDISAKSFKRNPFYTEIPKEEFISQYEKYLELIKEEFILIAEKNGEEIGFIFCIPNFNELKENGKLDTIIVKTVAVLPGYEKFAIGNILLNKIAKKAKLANFKNWIFAFMYENNTSQKMAKRNKTKLIREYSLYGKSLEKNQHLASLSCG